MADAKTGTLVAGTRAAPIDTANAEVATWTHGQGVEANKVIIMDSTTGALVLDADITVTQPDANTIVMTNASGGDLDFIAQAEWELGSPQNAGAVPASAIPVA